MTHVFKSSDNTFFWSIFQQCVYWYLKTKKCELVLSEPSPFLRLFCLSLSHPTLISALLRAYAPAVDVALLRRLTVVFGDLRQSVDAGALAYPYSTRELVAIARHVQRFPRDGLLRAIQVRVRKTWVGGRPFARVLDVPADMVS